MIQTTTKNKAKDGASAVLFGYQEICRVLDNPLHEVFNWAEKEKSSCFPGENGGKEKTAEWRLGSGKSLKTGVDQIFEMSKLFGAFDLADAFGCHGRNAVGGKHADEVVFFSEGCFVFSGQRILCKAHAADLDEAFFVHFSQHLLNRILGHVVRFLINLIGREGFIALP